MDRAITIGVLFMGGLMERCVVACLFSELVLLTQVGHGVLQPRDLNELFMSSIISGEVSVAVGIFVEPSRTLAHGVDKAQDTGGVWCNGVGFG